MIKGKEKGLMVTGLRGIRKRRERKTFDSVGEI